MFIESGVLQKIGHISEVPVLDGSESYQRGKVVLPINVTEVGSEQCMNGHYLQVRSGFQVIQLIISQCRGSLIHSWNVSDSGYVAMQPEV